MSQQPKISKGTEQCDYVVTRVRIYLGRIFGAATPLRALVKILSRISVGGISMVSVVVVVVVVVCAVVDGSLDLSALARSFFTFLFD